MESLNYKLKWKGYIFIKFFLKLLLKVAFYQLLIIQKYGLVIVDANQYIIGKLLKHEELTNLIKDAEIKKRYNLKSEVLN